MTTSITRFIRQLYRAPHTPTRFNPYKRRILRHNLKCYLVQMQAQRPHTLLVGEALGYRGGRLTGVPFSSEKLLMDGYAQSTILGAKHGYQLPQKATNSLASEQTATIVWETISTLTPPPLLWNAYPFHPHKPQKPQSNRPPTAAELAEGAAFLQALLNLYPLKTIIAVGNKAHTSLTKVRLPHQKVRHPAYGGKAEFVAGLWELLG